MTNKELTILAAMIKDSKIHTDYENNDAVRYAILCIEDIILNNIITNNKQRTKFKRASSATLEEIQA